MSLSQTEKLTQHLPYALHSISYPFCQEKILSIKTFRHSFCNCYFFFPGYFFQSFLLLFLKWLNCEESADHGIVYLNSVGLYIKTCLISIMNFIESITFSIEFSCTEQLLFMKIKTSEAPANIPIYSQCNVPTQNGAHSKKFDIIIFYDTLECTRKFILPCTRLYL